MPGCTFQEEWLQAETFKDWISRHKTNDNAAVCHICKKTFDLTTMGKTALTSHMKGKKHEKMMSIKMGAKQTHGSLKDFVINSSSVASPQKNPQLTNPSVDILTKQPETRTPFINKIDILNAEIWWCLKFVSSNYSFHSNDNITHVFRQMFPDSEIAKNMSCGETKSMYLSCFGISPYFRQLLEDKLKNTHISYTMLFDESLNRELQKKQLDILVRLWENDTVRSRYYTSEFLGHATATDLITTFENSLEKQLGLSNLIQVSMDGPNVNWSTFNKLQNKLELECDKKLINIGSCGLHQVHNAFRAGVSETDWDISNQLKALHTLFDETPARREDFENITKQSLYPLKLCSHRWVENLRVCERATELIPYIKEFVQAVNNKKVKDPHTKSFETVKRWCVDPFAKAKLAFLISVAKPIETFLTIYQSDKPLTPYLADDLEKLIRLLMARFVKDSVMSNAKSQNKLVLVDVNDKDNHQFSKNIDVGFIADVEIKKLAHEKKLSDKDVIQFRMECQKFLQKFVSRLLEKSPLNYKLLRNLSCLQPEKILLPDNCKGNVGKFKIILSVLTDCNRVASDKCDEIIQEYTQFLSDAKTLD